MIPKTDILITFRSSAPYRTEGYLRDLVDSIVANTPKCYRFIFVDDDCDDIGRAFVDNVANEFPTSLLIRTHLQHWFTRATNIGLRQVRTERAIALNVDTFCGHGWLEELYEVWAEVEKQSNMPVGLVGSVRSCEEARRWDLTPNASFNYVTGHAWMLNMKAVQHVITARGSFLDESRLDMAHIRSDVEVCLLLNKLGYLTVRSFKSHVDHFGGKSWGLSLPTVNAIELGYLNVLDGKD